ncbi:YDG domain-containing protein [Candidatus Rickettsiella viridis]|nr:YDG domain-containing protein [Candidatus Rickettsiella viridis]
MMNAQSAPIGAQVTAGTGSISQSGNTTTINQQSQNLSLNWNQFDIAPKETVNFAQPGRNAIAVNRVLGSNQASQIQGHLNANGQVWLINPNGVVFGKNSTVNVGGLLASTLDIADSELNKSQRQFSGSGTGSIINKGNIQAAKGGYVAMIANIVSNQGRITTPQGTTALAAGSQVTVTFAENQLTGIRIDKSTLNNLVENKQIIRANGGTVIMTAGAHDSLLSSAVNNGGIVEAQTVSKHKGEIILLGGMDAGTTTVSGTLDATAPHSGKGGSIETSAAHVKIAPEVKITTQSSEGAAGTWTIDPQDYTIAASGGDITGSQVSALLASNNIIISSAQGQTAGTGNLNVNNAITWSNTNSLTLNAVRNVNFNSGGTITNTAGGTLNVRADSGATGTGTIVMGGGSINISGAGGAINFYYNPATFGTPSTFTNVTAGAGTTFTPYMLINTPANLAAIATAPNNTRNYALGTNLNLSSIANFTPITFSGKFDGLNNTISNLTITGSNISVGLFNTLSAAAIVKNLTLSNVNVSGQAYVGSLAGTNNGTVSNITVSGSVKGNAAFVGGVFGIALPGSSGNCITSSVNVSATGINDISDYVGGFSGSITGGTYTNNTVTGSVTTGAHNRYIGGFAGYNNATIKNSSYTGTMITPYDGILGGFIGFTDPASVVQGVYSTATLNAGDYGYDSNGGLIGVNNGTIDSSYATGNLTFGQSWNVGGLVGLNANNISNSYATGNVSITPGPVPVGNGLQTFIQNYGGLVGQNIGGALSNVYATGNLIATGTVANSGTRSVGGLVGYMPGGSISRAYATGKVTAVASSNAFGGLLGYYAAGAITNVYASGNVSVTAVPGVAIPPSAIGGLIGFLGSGTLSNGYSIGSVNGSVGATNIGGLIGQFSGAVTGRSFWDTITSGRATSAGGANVVGMTTANMQTQANFTSATAANGNVNPNWNFSSVWAMGTGSYLYPVFSPPNAPVVTPGANCPPGTVSYYPLTLPNLSASNKVYDGTTLATVTGTLSGILPGDTVSVSSLSGTFNNKNVGTSKPVTVTQPGLSGANASKYLLVQVSLNNITANITPRPLTLTATAQSKVYNGTTATTTTTLTPMGVITGDIVSFSPTGTTATFDTKNVGNNKAVTVSNIVGSGADINNYSYLPITTTTANITKLALTLNAAANNKVYNGTTTATISTLTPVGVITGDIVSFSPTGTTATFDTKNVGNNKPVTVSNIVGSGADINNYSYQPTVMTAADITPLPITLNAVANNKVYDGTITATISTLTPVGVITGDMVIFSPTGVTAKFDTKDVGNGKSVMVSNIVGSGADINNYSYLPTTTTTADITKRALTLSAAADSKVYDGTTTTTVTALTPVNAISGDTINFNPATATATFDTKNVGNNKVVTVSNIIASGADAGNYSFASTTTTQANITQRALTLNVVANNKVYDGTTTATISTLTPVGVVTGDMVNFSPTGTTATFDTKNVGNNKAVTVSNITASGADAGNYSFASTTTTQADITQRALTLDAVVNSKVYDGTTTAMINTLTPAGVITGDIVSFNPTGTTATFDTKNVGNNKPVTVSNITASGADAGNYSFPSTINTQGNITQRALSLSAVVDNKVYDGTTTAILVSITPDNLISGDTVNFNPAAATATFNTKNVGRDKPVTVSNIIGSGVDINNYSYMSSITTTANITQRALTLSAVADNKVYDGTTTAIINAITPNDVITGDTVNFSPIGTIATFDTKNVGNNKAVTVSNITASGADAGNYSFPSTATAQADITQRALTLNAVANDKVYNGTTTAILAAITPNNVISGDVINFNPATATATFDTKNVGNNKAVTVSNITASGADAGNYSFPSTTTAQADITQRALTLNAVANNKVYDGTTTATISTLSPIGVVTGDIVNFNPTGTTATFDTKNVGNNKAVTVSNITASGADAGNYSFASTTTTQADITQRALTLNVVANDKVYNGTTTAILAAITPNNVISGDVINFNPATATATFDTKNVGNNKAVTVSNITASGADAGNYSFPSTTTTQADITQRALTLNVVANNKVYDGTTTATISTLTPVGVVTGDMVNFSPTGTTATFDTKNVGNGKPVTVSNIVGSGTDINNYSYLSTNNTTANITKLPLTLNAVVDNKVYNGTTTATVSALIPSNDVIMGDVINFSPIGTTALFNNKNAGFNKPVTVSNITASGADAGNYSYPSTISTIANINKRSIDVTAVANNKQYDKNATATASISSNDILSGDNVTYSYTSATFESDDVGNGKRVDVNNIQVSGPNGGNYVVNNPNVYSFADITQRPFSVKVIGFSKRYDGTTVATVQLTSTSAEPGDAIGISYSQAVFVNPGPGRNIPIAIENVNIGGSESTNYTMLGGSTLYTTADIYPLFPPPEPEPELMIQPYLNAQRNVAAVLDKPLTGYLYRSYDKPLTGNLFRTYEGLNLSVMRNAINVPVSQR